MRRALAAAVVLVLAVFAAEERRTALERQRQEIENQLQFVAAAMRDSPARAREIAGLLGDEFAGARLTPRRETPSGAASSIEVFRGEFDPAVSLDRRAFLEEFAALVAGFERVLSAEFRVASASAEGGVVRATVEYDFAGPARGAWRVEQSGRWLMDWRKDDGAWHILKWTPVEQARSVARRPVFVDATHAALGDLPQLRQSISYWRSVIDAAIGIGGSSEGSVAVGDIDGDGFDDIYVTQPAGLPNRLFRNQGDGTFRDVTESAGVGVLDGTSMVWFADIDSDGDQDLIVITKAQPLLFVNDGRGRFRLKRDASRFPRPPERSFGFDFDNDGRLDRYIVAPGRRAVLERGAGDGFDRVSGAAGLDLEDARAFAMADFDQDGDPDIVLKSPGSPQVRVLRNDSRDGNASVAFRLAGSKNNRDAIGAVVTIVTALGRQQRRLEISQHSKELLFGLGRAAVVEQVAIEWPGGASQTLRGVPVNHRIRVVEGDDRFRAEPFRPRNYSARVEPGPPGEQPRPAYRGTWLYRPRRAPEFGDYRGRPLVVNFWATWCVPCRGELRSLQQDLTRIEAAGARLVTVATNEPQEAEAVRAYARREGFTFPVLLPETAALASYAAFTNGVFGKTGELGVPTTLLIDGSGAAVKIYRGPAAVELIIADLGRLNAGPEERLRRATPFPGIFVASPR